MASSSRARASLSCARSAGVIPPDWLLPPACCLGVSAGRFASATGLAGSSFGAEAIGVGVGGAWTTFFLAQAAVNAAIEIIATMVIRFMRCRLLSIFRDRLQDTAKRSAIGIP